MQSGVGLVGWSGAALAPVVWMGGGPMKPVAGCWVLGCEVHERNRGTLFEYPIDERLYRSGIGGQYSDGQKMRVLANMCAWGALV